MEKIGVRVELIRENWQAFVDTFGHCWGFENHVAMQQILQRLTNFNGTLTLKSKWTVWDIAGIRFNYNQNKHLWRCMNYFNEMYERLLKGDSSQTIQSDWFNSIRDRKDKKGKVKKASTNHRHSNNNKKDNNQTPSAILQSFANTMYGIDAIAGLKRLINVTGFHSGDIVSHCTNGTQHKGSQIATLLKRKGIIVQVASMSHKYKINDIFIATIVCSFIVCIINS